MQRRLNFEMSVRNLMQSFEFRDRALKIQGLLTRPFVLGGLPLGGRRQIWSTSDETISSRYRLQAMPASDCHLDRTGSFRSFYRR
jgi:hypothetical protein